MRQVGIVLELEIDNHPKAAALGRKLLATMRSILDTQKRNLQEIEERNLGQSPNPT